MESMSSAPKYFSAYRSALGVLILAFIAALSFLLGLLWATPAWSDDDNVKIIYPKETSLDFEGQDILGEIKNPGEFYFKHRPPEKFDSLVKRRKNFHREMLRDAVLGR